METTDIVKLLQSDICYVTERTGRTYLATMCTEKVRGIDVGMEGNRFRLAKLLQNQYTRYRVFDFDIVYPEEPVDLEGAYVLPVSCLEKRIEYIKNSLNDCWLRINGVLYDQFIMGLSTSGGVLLHSVSGFVTELYFNELTDIYCVLRGSDYSCLDDDIYMCDGHPVTRSRGLLTGFHSILDRNTRYRDCYYYILQSGCLDIEYLVTKYDITENPSTIRDLYNIVKKYAMLPERNGIWAYSIGQSTGLVEVTGSIGSKVVYGVFSITGVDYDKGFIQASMYGFDVKSVRSSFQKVYNCNTILSIRRDSELINGVNMIEKPSIDTDRSLYDMIRESYTDTYIRYAPLLIKYAHQNDMYMCEDGIKFLFINKLAKDLGKSSSLEFGMFEMYLHSFLAYRWTESTMKSQLASVKR